MEDLWDKYNETRLAGDKKTATRLLLDFIAQLKQKDKKFIEDFANDLCKKSLDKAGILSNNGLAASNQSDRIQHPLFKEIILPVLAAQYLNNNPLHIRWIAQFEHFFYSDALTAERFLEQIKLEGHFSPLYFLEKSFSIDHQQDTLELLLQRQAQDIEFYLHELPELVLAEPDNFHFILADFKSYWSQFKDKEKWEKRLKEWKNIAGHWSDYTATKHQYKGFADYQEQHNITFD